MQSRRKGGRGREEEKEGEREEKMGGSERGMFKQNKNQTKVNETLYFLYFPRVLIHHMSREKVDMMFPSWLERNA